MSMFYFSLEDTPEKYRSQLDCIYLLGLCPSNILKVTYLIEIGYILFFVLIFDKRLKSYGKTCQKNTSRQTIFVFFFFEYISVPLLLNTIALLE
jgi:hypothetical protein